MNTARRAALVGGLVALVAVLVAVVLPASAGGIGCGSAHYDPDLLASDPSTAGQPAATVQARQRDLTRRMEQLAAADDADCASARSRLLLAGVGMVSVVAVVKALAGSRRHLPPPQLAR